MAELALWSVILIAVGFDYVNGFHDSANSIATVVSTRVLSPGVAVVWAAAFNFLAFFLFGTHVADTIAKEVVHQDVLSIAVIFAGLVGAIGLSLLTYWFGLPSSSSHALIGGIAGAAVAKAGFSALIGSGFRVILAFIVLSPLLGLAIGYVLTLVVQWSASRSRDNDRLNKGFRRGQLVSAAAYSLGHGANDAQKTMGIILALLIAGGKVSTTADVPLWVVLTCYSAISLGTMTGGWRIVKTMGTRLTRLQPVGGMCAELGAAASLFFCSANGIPVSTTQTITGGIVGVGAARRMSAVRWTVARRVVWAWVFTIPVAATISAVAYGVTQVFA